MLIQPFGNASLIWLFVMAKRMLFIGGESSGKTSICRVLSQIFGFPWVPEYGRELFERKGGKLTYEDMLEIGRVQVEREKIASICTRELWILCDTSPLVTMFYSLDWYGKIDPRLDALAKREYDKIFLCARDFQYVNDGTRSGEEFSLRQEQFYLERLMQPFEILHGSIESRVLQVQRSLK